MKIKIKTTNTNHDFHIGFKKNKKDKKEEDARERDLYRPIEKDKI